MVGDVAQSPSEDIRVSYTCEAADFRAVATAYRRRYRSRSGWASVAALGLILWFIGVIGGVATAKIGWVVAGSVGAVLLVVGGRRINKRQTRDKLRDLLVGPDVTMTIGEHLTYLCPGETLALAWGALTMQRTAHLLILYGPHGHLVYLPDRVADSPAAFEGIVAEVARRVHLGHEAVTTASGGR